MRVSEAINEYNTVFGKEIEIEGIAEISFAMSVIYDSRGKRGTGDNGTDLRAITGEFTVRKNLSMVI